jgi:hypothetical protein
VRETANWTARARTWLVLLLAIGSLGPTALAVPQAQVSARLSSGFVKLGGRVDLQVFVENAQQADVLELPVLEGLRIGPLSAPARREYNEVRAGGRVKRSVWWTWSIPVTPERTGEFTLPPLRLRVDGQPFETQPLTLSVVEDLRGQELLVLEIQPSSERVVEGEPFSVELLFGWEVGINNPADVQLALPWWNNLPGVLEIQPEQRGLQTRTFEVPINRTDKGEVEEVAARESGGRRFRLFRARRTYLPTRSGTLEFPTSFLAFTQLIERGRAGFFESTPDKTQQYFTSFKAFHVEVVPLPEEGRPFDFTGAVGVFQARAEVDRRDVDQGDSIKLTVEWSGRGNLEFFDVPDIARREEFKGFRVYGVTERKASSFRVAVYDLAPIDSTVAEIPPVPLPYYDSEQGAYASVATAPIPIRVRELASHETLAPAAEGFRGERDVRDIAVAALADPDAERSGPGTGATAAALALVPLSWLCLRSWVRRRGAPDAPAERARRKARKHLSRRLRGAERAQDQLDAVHSFLAARSREGEQAWVGRDLREALPDIAAQDLEPMARLYADLERAAYAEDNRPIDGEAILRAADRLVGAGL